MDTMSDTSGDCARAGTAGSAPDPTTDAPKATGTDATAPGGATDSRDSGTANFTFKDTSSGTSPGASSTLTIGTTPTSASLSGSFTSASDGTGADTTDPSGSGTSSFTFTDTASGTNPRVSGTLTLDTTPTSASLSGSFSSFSDGTGADTVDPSGSGSAMFAFTDTASGTKPNVSGTLMIGTTPISASLSGSFSSSSDDPINADPQARGFADTAKAIASGDGDTSLLNDLSSGVIGPASGLGTDAGGQGSPIQQPTGHGGQVVGLHDGQGGSAMTGAHHHQFSA